jgi:hypothetical protein
MRTTLLSRLAAAGGIAYVALLTIGDDLIAKGEGPALDASRAEIAQFLADHYDQTQFLIGRGIGLVGVAMLIPFFIALRWRLRDTEREASLLPDLALAGGAFAALAQALAFVPHLAGRLMLETGELSPDIATTLYTLASGFFVLSWAGLALALVSVAAAAIPTRSLPRALTWTAPALAAGLLVGLVTLPGVAGFMAFFLCFFWLIGASVALLRATPARTDREARPPTRSGLRGRLATLLALTAALMSVAACGEDDASGGDESSVTKAQFVAAANEICAAADKQINVAGRDFFESLGRGAHPSDGQIVEFGEREVVPIFEQAIERLRGLEPPVGDEQEIERILAAADEGTERLAGQPESILDEEPSRADRLFAAYGITTSAGSEDDD